MIQVKEIILPLAKQKGCEHDEKSETVEGAVKVAFLATTSKEAHNLEIKLREITNVVATKTIVKKSTATMTAGFTASTVVIKSHHTLMTATVAENKVAQLIALLSDKTMHIDCHKRHLAQLSPDHDSLAPHMNITFLHRIPRPAKPSMWQSLASLWQKQRPTKVAPLLSAPSINDSPRLD